MKRIVLVIFAAFVVGCAPIMTLEDMEEAEKAATTPEEKKELKEKIDQFYVNWENANRYFENKVACQHNIDYQFICVGGHGMSYNGDIGKLSKEQKIRVWKKEQHDCQCLTNEDAEYFMRELQRQMRVGSVF